MSEARIAEALATIPVSVITGFLGSGKTTLLNALLARPEMRDTAVLVNEFGEVGLDHLLVQQVTEEIVLLNSGCICCTVREDLVQSLRELFIRRLRGEVPPFRRVAIETTGLADPAPVIQTLITDVTLADRYRVDGIVTTVDAVLGSDQLDRHPESVKQAAVADRLVLTKVDLASAAARDTLRRRLKDINPGAALIEAVNGEVEPATLLNVGLYDPETKSADVRRWLNDAAYALADAENHDHGHGDGHDHEHDHGHEHGHDHRHHSVNRHDDHIGAFCLVHDRPIPWHGFVTFLEALLATQGQNVLRIKGLLNVIGQDRPIVVHGVQHVFHPPAALPAWPDADRSSRIVFITHDIGRAAVEQTFHTFIQAALEAEAGAATDAEPTSRAAGRDR